MTKKNSDKILFLVGSLCLIILHFSPIIRTINYRALDLFRNRHTPTNEIVILAIDNKSLQSIGRFPWSREIHGKIINELNKFNPKIVGIDIIFAEPESEKTDRIFADSIKSANFKVVLATEAVYFKGISGPQNLIHPIEKLLSLNNVSLGHTNLDLDSDGVARILPKNINFNNELSIPFANKISILKRGDNPDYDKALVDFAGPAGTYSTFSISELLEGKIPESSLKNKIILIGATAADLRDIVLTPNRTPVMAGVEWHANAIDNILNDRFVKLAGKQIEFSVGLFISLLIAIAYLKLTPQKVSFVFLSSAIALPIVSFGAWQFRLGLPYFINLFWVGILFVAHTAHRWYVAEAEKRRLRQSFEPYFSPQILELIIRDPASLKLGGQHREVTILFSDIRSFTTITESLSAEKLTKLLQEYFEAMTQEVFDTGGVIDKFIGDAILAFWGAPIDQPDHPDRAARAALGMISRLKTLQKKWQHEGLPFVNIGVGINTGEVTVGNMGSGKRFDYTVIGDAVNAASRLEGLNKEYKTNIIISQTTKEKLTQKIQIKSLGQVVVKGKTKAIKIYKIVV